MHVEDTDANIVALENDRERGCDDLRSWFRVSPWEK
jgi:hypothetical protein